MSSAHPIPECITRDRLTSPYWPNLSFAGLASVVVLGLVFMLTSFHRLNHTDLWGHLSFGRWIVSHHALPASDPLTAAPSQIAPLHSAWLAQTLGHIVHELFGSEGLVFSHALLVTLTAGVLMLAVYRRGAPAIWSAAAGLAMLLLYLPIFGTLRPQLFGQLGAALFLLAIAELPRQRHPLYWLPLVSVLWANLHGSLLIGLAILAIHVASCVYASFRKSRSIQQLLKDQDVQRTAVAMVLVAIAGCLNPHGLALYAHIAGFGDHPALASISEWQAFSLQSLTGVLVVGSLIATAVAWKYSQRPWQATDVLLLLIFGLALIPAIRMLAWWALIWPFVVWPHLAFAWRSRHQQSAAANEDQPTSMRTVMALGFVFMAILVAPPTFSIVAGRARGEGLILVTDTPVYVADEVLRRGLAGTIAAPPDWADFLVWKTNSALQPLVHGHVHLADAEAWRDYETIFRGDDAWLPTLRKHQMQYVVVPRRRYPALAKQVLTADRNGQGEVRIIYQDQRCIMAEVKLEAHQPLKPKD